MSELNSSAGTAALTAASLSAATLSAETLSPAFNPLMQAFVSEGDDINGITYQQLVSKHGSDNVNNALFNMFNDSFVSDIKAQYKGSPIEDDAIDFMNSQLSSAKQHTTLAAQHDIDTVYQDLLKFYAEQRLEEINGTLLAGPGESGKGSSKELNAGGNWLVVLARFLGSAAGEHLEQAVITGYKLGDVSGRSNQSNDTQAGRDANAAKAKDMAMLQAEMQAHTQMFKMAFEATATLIKTTGEGLATMARKQ